LNCQECGIRPASLHFTKIVNGQKTEYRLCEVCAKEKGDIIPGTNNAFSIHNLLSGLLNYDPLNTGNKGIAKPLRCETCGLSYTQFSQSGRFGCSDCYKAFDHRLDPLFKRVHGNTTHGGKIPRRAGAAINSRRKLQALKQLLQQKIEHEEFEEAARIRDQIRELEKNIGLY
jgi:protein arginine kinase activator